MFFLMFLEQQPNNPTTTVHVVLDVVLLDVLVVVGLLSKKSMIGDVFVFFQAFPQTMFLPWAAYVQLADGTQRVIEQDALVTLLHKQPLENKDRLADTL